MNSIITKLIYNLRKENIDNTAINDIIQKLKEYWLYLGVIDWDNISYVGILKAIYCAKFLKTKFNDDNKLSIMHKTLVFRDDGICIFKPTNFEESSIIGEPICCFAYSRGRWDEHYEGYKEAIYYVYDVRRDNTKDFVAITVRPNGKALVLDKNHKWWGENDSMRYIRELGRGADLIVTKSGNPIKTTNNNQRNENRTMAKKQVIRLNENQLRRIVSESVKRVLNESTWHGPEYFEFSALEDEDEETKHGATYILSDNLDGRTTWKVPVYIKNRNEEKQLWNLCYGGGYRRFNGGKEVYDFGKVNLPQYGKTLSISEFEQMLRNRSEL